MKTRRKAIAEELIERIGKKELGRSIGKLNKDILL